MNAPSPRKTPVFQKPHACRRFLPVELRVEGSESRVESQTEYVATLCRCPALNSEPSTLNSSMSPPFLIIDGYNLLHAAGLARLQYGPGDLERARQRLLALLAEKLRAEERRRCTIVFDAQQAPPDLPPPSDHHGITVQFAPAGLDADTVIEQLIAHHPASRRMIVVSGDHRLQKAAKRRNATPVDSESFLNELDRRTAISPWVESPEDAVAPSRKSPAAAAGKKEDWSAVFGDIDVQELNREVDRESMERVTNSPTEADRLDELQRQLDDPEFLERWLRD